MTRIFTRLALAGALLIASGASVQAGVNTYQQGSWAVAARAGVAPSAFSEKGKFTSTLVNAGGVAPADLVAPVTSAKVVQRTTNFSYSKAYSVPFAAGADIGYFVQDNWEVFVNFDFEHACGKKINHFTPVDSSDLDRINNNEGRLEWRTRDSSSYSYFFGSRYYFSEVVDGSLVPFIGAKLGVKTRGNCSGKETVDFFFDGAFIVKKERQSAKGCSAFAGGLQLGCDWMFVENYALTFMAEAQGTSSRLFKSGRQATTTTSDGDVFFTNVSKNPRSVVSFPLTLGIRVRL